jgi:hypothetical protein
MNGQFCQWDTCGEGVCCIVCFTYRSTPRIRVCGRRPIAMITQQKRRPIENAVLDEVGLGDLAAEFFASLGVTPETYQATKESLHLLGGCRCDRRKRLLNAVGERLGINDAAAAMANWLMGR